MPKRNDLEQKALHYVINTGYQGVLQSDLWRELGASSREGSRVSIKLEEKLSRFHLQNIVKFADPSFCNQFTKVIQADQERIALFKKTYEELEAPRQDNSFQCDLTI